MDSTSGLTVYITTYNRADFLRESIKSVLGQTMSDLKLVVLDNCSTDSTPEVIKEFDDPRLTSIRHEKNIGGIANIDYAFDNNNSEYIVVFHDDDMMKPEMIEQEYKFLQEHPDVTCVSSLTTFLYSDGSTKDLKPPYEGEYMIYEGHELFDAYFGIGTGTVCPTIMYRQSFLTEHKLNFDPTVGPCCDIKCLFDIERFGGKVASLNKNLIMSRQHEHQDSIVNNIPMHAMLYDYLAKDEYYAPLLESREECRNELYHKYSKGFASLLVQGKGDRKKLIECEKLMRGALKGRAKDRIIYTVCRFVSAVSPHLAKSIYKAHKRGNA